MQETSLGPDNGLTDRLFPIAAEMFANAVHVEGFVVDATLVETAGNMIIDAAENGDAQKLKEMFVAVADELIESAAMEVEQREDDGWIDDFNTSYVMYAVYMHNLEDRPGVVARALPLITADHFKKRIEATPVTENPMNEVISLLSKEDIDRSTYRLGEIAADMAIAAQDGTEGAKDNAIEFINRYVDSAPEEFARQVKYDTNM